MSIGLQRGIVELSDHNNDWTDAFNDEKEILLNILQDYNPEIEHVGSTAIFGIKAKPILDILIGLSVDKFNNLKNDFGVFKDNGYEFRENGSDDNHLLFVKGSEDKRTHYIHVVEFKSDIWHADLKFRTILRNNTNVRDKYEKLKIELAEKFPNSRGEYTAAKQEFITDILDNYER